MRNNNIITHFIIVIIIKPYDPKVYTTISIKVKVKIKLTFP